MLMYPPREYLSKSEAIRPRESSKLFMELNFSDPLVFGLIELRGWYYILADTTFRRKAEFPQEKLDVLHSSIQKINTCIKREIERWGQTYMTAPKLGVGGLLSSFDAFVELMRDVEKTYSDLNEYVGLDRSLYEPLLNDARNELESMIARQKLITPEHLVMQNHLEHFVTSAMPTIYTYSVDSAQHLYSPLFALRDEYFTEPRLGLVREYLDAATYIERTPEFRALASHCSASRVYDCSPDEQALLKQADTRVEGLALELEVIALTEEAAL
jgi:hypothetical protein